MSFDYKFFTHFISELVKISPITPIECQVQINLIEKLVNEPNYKNKIEQEFTKWLIKNKEKIISKQKNVFEMNIESENILINQFLNNLSKMFETIGEENQKIVWEYLIIFINNL